MTEKQPKKMNRKPRPEFRHLPFQMAPCRTMSLAAEYCTWQGIIASAVTDPKDSDLTYVAAMNYMWTPDFCAGVMLGCVNMFTRRRSPAGFAPPVVPRPDDLPRVCPPRLAGYDIPLLSLWAYALGGLASRHNRTAAFIYDRRNGFTRQTLEAVLPFIGNCYLPSGSTNTGATVIRSVRHSKPWLNTNSRAMVTATTIFLTKQAGVPSPPSPPSLLVESYVNRGRAFVEGEKSCGWPVLHTHHLYPQGGWPSYTV